MLNFFFRCYFTLSGREAMVTLWVMTTDSSVALYFFSMTTCSQEFFCIFYWFPWEEMLTLMLSLFLNCYFPLSGREIMVTLWQLTPLLLFASSPWLQAPIFCVFLLIPMWEMLSLFLWVLCRTLRPRSHGNIMTTDSSVALCLFSVTISTFYLFLTTVDIFLTFSYWPQAIVFYFMKLKKQTWDRKIEAKVFYCAYSLKNIQCDVQKEWDVFCVIEVDTD